MSTEYDEYSRIDPNANYFTRLCVAWEAAAELPKPIRSVILRLGESMALFEMRMLLIGVVLGRNGGIVSNSFWPFYLGFGGPIGSGEQYFPWIHVDDCVGKRELHIEFIICYHRAHNSRNSKRFDERCL